jgi:polyisoprenoid-binding protein YceI
MILYTPRMRALLIAVATSLAAPVAVAAPTYYEFDRVHSQVLFFASHLGFSHPMGRFPALSGGFNFDPDDWTTASAHATIDVKSLYLGDEGWQKKMLSDEFFDAAKYPTMTFTADKLEKTGDHRATLHGALTLHGVTKPVDLAVTVNRVGMHSFSMQHVAGFSATGTIKRSDFGMTHLLPAVGDEVEIRLEIEGLKAKPPSP